MSCLCIFGIMLPHAYGAQPPADTPSTKADIWRVLQSRQVEASRARATWRSTLILPAERVRAMQYDLPGSSDTPDAAPEVRLPESKALLELSGLKVRYETMAASFRGTDNGAGVPHVTAFDGKELYWLSERSGRPDRQSTGTVGTADAFDSWNNIHILPLMYAFRPLHPTVLGEAARWSLLDMRETISGQDCIVLRMHRDDGDQVITVYLSAAHLCPIRVTMATDEIMGVKIDMAYNENGLVDHVPTQWIAEMHSRNGLLESSVNYLIKAELGPDLPDDRFRIDFPVGTIVTNRKTDKSVRVQPNGEMTPLAQEDVDRERVTSGSAGSRWWTVGGTTVLLCVLALLLARRIAFK